MQNKKVLITGGGGFLGRALAGRLVGANDVVLMCKDAAGSASVPASAGCETVTADVTRIGEVRATFVETRPEIVIHAAAMKSVTRCESEPLECSDLNVIGSQNVARAAMDIGCEGVLGISSNRAAPPTSDTYGLTKAIMERMFCSLNDKTDTDFASVRLGNIVWSPGSVLPTWRQMLADTGVIGTTGPQMRRFFTSLDEAVDLVMMCADQLHEFGGRVVARRMKHARIEDILAAFVELNGGSWEQIEARAGDNFHETLIGDLELRYCRETTMNGLTHYILSFNEAVEAPMSTEISTENAEPLSAEEIASLIDESAGHSAALGGTR